MDDHRSGTDHDTFPPNSRSQAPAAVAAACRSRGISRTMGPPLASLRLDPRSAAVLYSCHAFTASAGSNRMQWSRSLHSPMVGLTVPL
jgi:hypothetical protein